MFCLVDRFGGSGTGGGARLSGGQRQRAMTWGEVAPMCNRRRAIPKNEDEEENKPTSPSGKVDWWLGHCGRGPGGGPILGATGGSSETPPCRRLSLVRGRSKWRSLPPNSPSLKGLTFSSSCLLSSLGIQFLPTSHNARSVLNFNCHPLHSEHDNSSEFDLWSFTFWTWSHTGKWTSSVPIWLIWTRKPTFHERWWSYIMPLTWISFLSCTLHFCSQLSVWIAKLENKKTRKSCTLELNSLRYYGAWKRKIGQATVAAFALQWSVCSSISSSSEVL
jgi:hypothetical protein